MQASRWRLDAGSLVACAKAEGRMKNAESWGHARQSGPFSVILHSAFYLLHSLDSPGAA